MIPRFNNATLTGIAIRTVDMLQLDAPALVEGSDGKPLAMPGFREEKLFARVADDLDCVLLQQEVWDFCSVVSLEKPGQETDKETASLLKSAKLFFVIHLLLPPLTEPFSAPVISRGSTSGDAPCALSSSTNQGCPGQTLKGCQ